MKTSIRTAVFIAYKSIARGSKGTLVLMIFILSLSFINMMFVSGMLTGLGDMIERAVIDNISAHVMLSPEQEPRLKQFIPDQDMVRAQIEALPGVVATARHYMMAGALAFDKDKNNRIKSVSGQIIGLDPQNEGKVLALDRLLIAGELLSPSDHDQILLSSALAGGYGIFAPSDLGGARVGDKVRLTFANGVSRMYKIKGIYNDSIGIYETFITSDEAESVLSTYNSASQILVRVDLAKGNLADYKAKIHSMFPNLKIQTYNDLLGSFTAFLAAILGIAYVVSAISVIVAAVTIFVLIYVNAIHKRRQMGILRAMGIRRSTIVLSFVLQAVFYTFSGVAIGSLFVFTILVPWIYAHPVTFDFGTLHLVYNTGVILGGILSLLAAGLLAGYIPSRLVAREEILKAIWG